MIAGIEIPVVLQGEGLSARRLKDAEAGPAKPIGQGGIECLNEDLADIPVHPLVEDGRQETAVVLRFDRPLGDQVAALV